MVEFAEYLEETFFNKNKNAIEEEVKVHNPKVINIKYQPIKFNKRPTVQSLILIISYSIESASHQYIISKTYRIVKLFNHPFLTCLFFPAILSEI